MTNTLANGYNVLPTTTIHDAPIAQPESKPRTMTMFFCGLQWAIISGIVMYFSHKSKSNVFPCALVALMLASTIAALGLVWGVFQHVLKTIVRIVRHGA